MRRSITLLASLLLLGILPSVQGHSAATPIEAEDLVLDDEATDTTAAWDGFDIMTVHFREAFFFGQDGFVVRWTLWGGDTQSSGNEHIVQLNFEEPSDMQLAWQSDNGGETWRVRGQTTLNQTNAIECLGQIIDNTFEQDSEGPADIPTWNVQFQAFVPLCGTELQPGDSLIGMSAWAYANGNVVDAAPGGYYPYGGDQEAQDPGLTSERLIDELILDGADRYTNSTIGYEQGHLMVNVTNLIGVTGQHAILYTSETPIGVRHDVAGTTANGSATSLEPSEGVVFHATFEDFDELIVEVRTDLGGREQFVIQGDGTILDADGEVLQNAAFEESVETPGVGFVSVMALLAVAFVARRK